MTIWFWHSFNLILYERYKWQRLHERVQSFHLRTTRQIDSGKTKPFPKQNECKNDNNNSNQMHPMYEEQKKKNSVNSIKFYWIFSFTSSSCIITSIKSWLNMIDRMEFHIANDEPLFFARSHRIAFNNHILYTFIFLDTFDRMYDNFFAIFFLSFAHTVTLNKHLTTVWVLLVRLPI